MHSPGAALATLSLTACAGLANYFTPTIEADNEAVASDTVTVNNDLLKAKADYATKKAALPADAIKLATDQAVLRAGLHDSRGRSQSLRSDSPGRASGPHGDAPDLNRTSA